MNETAKTLALFTEEQKKEFLSGKGIDIGCGNDPVTPDCYKFDMEQGDANHILDFVKEQFDFVWSSHCLEHMRNPRKAILEWWSLVKPGRYMIILLPDEDLYEQGVFPSRFNGSHTHTFTISKYKSWSPVSINVLDLLKAMPDVADYSIQLQDCGYDRTMLSFGRLDAVDQTLQYPDRLAQIQLIVKKTLFPLRDTQISHNFLKI